MCRRYCVLSHSKSFKAMATSDAMPRRPRLFHRAVPCLLLCAAWLVVFDALHRLSFVQGVALHGTRAAQRQVAQRFSQKGQQARGELNADGKVEARRLTSSIKKAYSAVKLIEVLDGAVDGPIFNFFHASAAYTQLARLKRKRDLQQRDWDSPVLLRLHTRVEHMMGEDQLEARALANVLWSIARLANQLSIPTQLLAALVKSLPAKVKGMDEQNLSNSLWACAKLKEVAFASTVLEIVPAIVAQIPKNANDMVPLALSNCLWASAQLKDEVPKVVEIVPAIVREISLKINDMVPQQLSNSVEALVLSFFKTQLLKLKAFSQLVDGGNDILSSAAARLNTLLPRLGKDFRFTVPVVACACAKAEVYDGELLASVARRLGSRSKLSALPDFGICALS